MELKLSIKELVLHGIPFEDRFIVSQSLQLELTRLLTEQGLPSALNLGKHISCINCKDLEVPESKNPKSVGIQLAQSIFGGLNG